MSNATQSHPSLVIDMGVIGPEGLKLGMRVMSTIPYCDACEGMRPVAEVRVLDVSGERDFSLAAIVAMCRQCRDKTKNPATDDRVVDSIMSRARAGRLRCVFDVRVADDEEVR